MKGLTNQELDDASFFYRHWHDLQLLDSQAVIQIDRTQSKVEVESQALRQTLINAITEEGYGVT